VLIAVFVPMAFFPGSTGAIYRQFSVTLTVSIFLSTLLALTLGVAMSATLLGRKAKTGDGPDKHTAMRWPARVQQRVFDAFNRGMESATERYVRAVEAMLRAPVRWLAVFLVVCVATGFLFTQLPRGFIPGEDPQDYPQLSRKSACKRAVTMLTCEQLP